MAIISENVCVAFAFGLPIIVPQIPKVLFLCYSKVITAFKILHLVITKAGSYQVSSFLSFFSRIYHILVSIMLNNFGLYSYCECYLGRLWILLYFSKEYYFLCWFWFHEHIRLKLQVFVSWALAQICYSILNWAT